MEKYIRKSDKGKEEKKEENSIEQEGLEQLSQFSDRLRGININDLADGGINSELNTKRSKLSNDNPKTLNKGKNNERRKGDRDKAIEDKGNEKEEFYKINLLNVQGLTNAKIIELEELMDNKSLLCLTETQLKIQKVNIDKEYRIYDSMRETNDKKGGGILMMHRISSNFNLNQLRNSHKDYVYVEGEIGGIKLFIFLVYFSVNDNERNDQLRKEIETHLNKIWDEAVLVLGDFNGHVGFMGYQKLNKNGQIVLGWMERYSLIMLNDDFNCEGVYTWSRNEQKSVIDYVLVSPKFYDIYEGMIIDEKQEMFDLSDHNLLQVKFKTKNNVQNEFNSNRWDKVDYYKTDPDSLKQYVQKLEARLITQETADIEKLNETIRATADLTLKATYKRRKGKGKRKTEPPWMNIEIREGIKRRKKFNRLCRNASTEGEQQNYKDLYLGQKEKTQIMIKEAIYEHEQKLSREIREGGNASKNKWAYINKLRKKEVKEKKELKVYSEGGIELTEKEAKEEIIRYWSDIYKKHANDIAEEWDRGEEHRYNAIAEEENRRVDNLQVHLSQDGQINTIDILQEHMEMIGRTNKNLVYMGTPKISVDELKMGLKKLKNKKAAGPDQLKPELYKSLLDSAKCMEVLVNCYNKVLEENTVPIEWKQTKTIMIPKNSKPSAKDLRPIALANISYKIFMSTAVKNKIEEHLKVNDQVKEVQSGFTKGGRVENNLFILKHIVEKSYLADKPLIVVSIDFSKAYDSVKRGNLIKVMKDYKIHPDLINTVANVYTGDHTDIVIGNMDKIKMNISSGIKQGCTGSTSLFKLVTYDIIKQMEEEGEGYEDWVYKLSVLFFADDGLILTQSIGSAERAIAKLINIGARCGLEINKVKSKVIIFNAKETPEKIGNIKVATEIEYLGIKLENKRNCFKRQKELSISKAEQMANLTYPIIAQSCNKILIGKTFWKSVALPSILYGASILGYTKTEIEKLQIIENKVYRQILGAPRYAQVGTLRGEIGASSMLTRVRGGQLKYLKYVEGNDEWQLLQRIMQEKHEFANDPWFNSTMECLRETNLKYDDLLEIGKSQVNDKIKKWDTKIWEEEIGSKNSLVIYRKYKKEIKSEEEIYDNRPASEILYQARTNNLRLKDRNRFTGGDVGCDMCGAEMEDLEHFILWCPAYTEIKMKEPLYQQPYIEDTCSVLGNLLFNKQNIDRVKKILYSCWQKRKNQVNPQNQ